MPPNTVTQSLLTETTVLWLCILISVLGLLALGGVVWFGIFLSRGRLRRLPDEDILIHFIERWLHNGPGGPPNLRPVRYMVDAYSEYLQRRNEFWTSYGQIIVAALIIIVLTILLLTKSISAEAGLPVLSGISGFAIAKSVSTSRQPSSGDDQRG
jgi:hypothetical protein